MELMSTNRLLTYPHGMERALASSPRFCGTILPMKRIHVVFHDGGGDIATPPSLCRRSFLNKVATGRWNLFSSKTLRTAGRFAETYRHPHPAAIQHPAAKRLDSGQYVSPASPPVSNTPIHRPLVSLLERFWRDNPADLLISVIPHFNRQICESWTKAYPHGRLLPSSPTWRIFHRDSGLSRSTSIRHCGH